MIEATERKKRSFVEVTKFQHMLEKDIWTPSLTPLELLAELERINSADLAFAIIVDPITNDVYDGVHRLVKAVLNKEEYILCVELTKGEFMALPEKT
jgi:hypothetical protein